MGNLFEQSAAVFIVIALLIATLCFLRPKGVATLKVSLRRRMVRGHLIQVLERVPLTAQHSLHLVRLGDRALLIGVSPTGCTGIDSFPASQCEILTDPEVR
jgi:flagellar biogenesis protein FliO